MSVSGSLYLRATVVNKETVRQYRTWFLKQREDVLSIDNSISRQWLRKYLFRQCRVNIHLTCWYINCRSRWKTSSPHSDTGNSDTTVHTALTFAT